MSGTESFGSAVAGCNSLAEARQPAGNFCKCLVGVIAVSSVGRLNSVKVLPTDETHVMEREKLKKPEKAMFRANQIGRR